MIDKTEVLKPCPFCGEQPDVHKTSVYIACINKKCEIRPAAKYYHTVEQAAKDWNIRAHETSLSPYKEYTWEDVAMLVQENKRMKEQLGISCDDEGCPHYGTKHGHDNLPAQEAVDEVFGLSVQIADAVFDKITTFPKLEGVKAAMSRYEASKSVEEIIRPYLRPISETPAGADVMREALEFYADTDNYIVTEAGYPCVMATDKGRRAKQALSAQPVTCEHIYDTSFTRRKCCKCGEWEPSPANTAETVMTETSLNSGVIAFCEFMQIDYRTLDFSKQFLYGELVKCIFTAISEANTEIPF